MEFEHCVFAVHNYDVVHRCDTNMLWVNINTYKQNNDEYLSIHNHYCTVYGTINMHDHGHFGAYIGEIDVDVVECDP